jgi:hypothetical protein
MKIQYIKQKGLSVLVMLIMVGIVSCKKLIEIPSNPITQIPQSGVFADSADIMSSIAGIYANLKIPGGGTNIFNGMLTTNMGLAADELTFTSVSTFQSNTYTATDGTVGSLWSSPYANLYQVNVCLEGISSTKAISNSLKQSLLAELKVLRALNYFYLVNLFGDVPRVTTTDYKVNQIMPRSPVDSIYKQIVTDLTDARKVLKARYPSAGHARPNVYTADALLARVYLYRGQYAEAESMASKVIDSAGLYSLVPINNVFLDGSNEAIWQLPAVGTSYQTNEAYSLIPFSAYSAPSYQVTSYLLNSFEQNDQRKTTWTKTSTVSGKTYYYVNKYKNRSSTATPIEGYVCFRLAEQYLIRAEARAQQGGTKLAGAITDLNAIRTRAGLGITTATTQTDLLSAIIRERRVELFAEWGHRWFDLKRTGTIDAVLAPIKPGWLSSDATLPVPNNEIKNDPFLKQNTGY